MRSGRTSLLLAAILVVGWLIGLLMNVFGGLIHLLLVLAIIVVIANFVLGRRSTA